MARSFQSLLWHSCQCCNPGPAWLGRGCCCPCPETSASGQELLQVPLPGVTSVPGCMAGSFTLLHETPTLSWGFGSPGDILVVSDRAMTYFFAKPHLGQWKRARSCEFLAICIIFYIAKGMSTQTACLNLENSFGFRWSLRSKHNSSTWIGIFRGHRAGAKTRPACLQLRRGFLKSQACPFISATSSGRQVPLF